MVNGLAVFRKYFNAFNDSYIIIGGTACESNLAEEGLKFRSTRDIDILIIIEKYEEGFNKQFWQFIKDGKYNIRQRDDGKKQLYRFLNPANATFPYMIELLCKKPDYILPPHDQKIMPLPLDEYLSNLSAIILNDDYYKFTIEHSHMINDIHIASTEALICLKVYAYLNLKEREEKGENIRSEEINKHKRDVFRLGVTLKGEDSFILPETIKIDMNKFLSLMQTEQPQFQSIFKYMGLPDITIENIFRQLKDSFNLTT